MEMTIIDQLSALAHPVRLDLFRLLMRRYPDAVPAGEIARALALKANTTSTYLNALRRAGLIEQERRGASLEYRADITALQGFMGDLMTGCCKNRPDICLRPEDDARWVPSQSRPLRVLFLCTANAARSIMAQALLNHMGQGRFIATSAGTHPREAPDANVLAHLNAKGLQTSDLRSQSLSAVLATEPRAFDLVITVCDQAANEDCPFWPGAPLSCHWGLKDPLAAPKAEQSQAIEAAYSLLHSRISKLVALPFETLKPAELQGQLDLIASSKNT